MTENTRIALPDFSKLRASHKLRFEPSDAVMARWLPGMRAEASGSVLRILAPIGETWDGDGITGDSVARALDGFGGDPVTVLINSPGGDMFDGLAIYNLLREYPAAVTVKIVGLAASAASVIAMAGDTVEIAKSGFLMIHNAWVFAVGDRNDLLEIAATLEPFDEAMAAIYADNSGLALPAIREMMDKDTWISGEAAIEQGFADDFLPADQLRKDAAPAASARLRLDAALAKAGLPRSERRKLLQDLKAGTPRAADDDKLRAVEEVKRRYTAEVFEAAPQLKEFLSCQI